MVEITANLHMHTPYSDGEKYHRDIADAAARAQVDVVITTDHNVLVCGVDGYTSGVLVLAGEEVHDCRRAPQANHCLVYNANDELSPFAAHTQALLNEVRKRGGLSFFAHPYEYGSPISSDLAPISWLDWNLRNFTGIEIWNYMSEFKARLWSYPAAIFDAFFPSLVIRGPFRATLRKWDELLNSGQRVVAIGNSDAHGTPMRLGPLRRVIFPYEYLFRCVNTHLLIDKPLTRDVAADKQLVYGAMQAGHCFVSYDLTAPAKGFSFTAQSGADKAVMGDELTRRGAVRLEVKCPATGTIQLLRNGQVVAMTLGHSLEYTTVNAGVYRVEVYRTFRFASRGWIYSNPIYVK
jgi:hypothetical protein